MKQDQQFIQEKFSQDGIRAPESLSVDHIRELLEENKEAHSKEYEHINITKSSIDKKSRIRRRMKPARYGTIAAACLLIAILVFPAAHSRLTGISDPPVLTESGELYTFKSYHEIRSLVNDLNRSTWDGGALLFQNRDAMVTEEAQEAPESASSQYSAADSESATGTSGGAPASNGIEKGFSSTYLQVQDVDEADIIKTDGKYIYYVNQNEEILIYSAANGQTTKVAEIGKEQSEYFYHDIFLKEDLLITVGTFYDDEENSSAVVTYDISDRASPKKTAEFRQSGQIVSSRMVKDFVYLVTRETVYSRQNAIPMVTKNGNYEEMELSDLCSVPEPKSSSYVILSSVDVMSGNHVQCKSKAILGASENIYCNNQNLYTTASEYNEKTNSTYTRIIRASLDGTKIQFESTGTVSGTINDQFSMDEKDGSFRVATTSFREGMELNHLFILNQDLKEIGKVSGFAKNESIRAVRFIGDRAYVITFRQVDPLFVIDLGDPSQPSIEGEVEIDGFSSLLVPLEGERLLGIGYLTKDNGYGGVYQDGLKLALFDVSDPAHPVVLDSKEFDEMSSPAQITHLALTINTEQGYFAIPYSQYPDNHSGWFTTDGSSDSIANGTDTYMEDDSTGSILTSGVLVFGVDNGIRTHDIHPLAKNTLERTVYINEWLYSLDQKGDVYSFEVSGNWNS